MIDKAQRPVINLSAVQARVMELMSQGWPARTAHGSSVHINGSRVCNVDTMTTLERHGLVERDPQTRTWEATQDGRKLSPNYKEPETEE